MRPQATVVLDGFGTLESLRWHDGALWFCDFAHGTVHRWDTLGEPETVLEVPGRAGGLGWLPDGRMLVVSMDGRRVHRQEPDGSLVVHADLGDIAGGPVNDMLVDGQGRAYVGNFGFDYHGFVRQRPNAMLYAPPGPPTAPLACLSPEGELLGLSEPLVFPNGCFLLDEGRTLLVAETLAMRLTALPVLPDGRLGPPRPWAPLAPAWLWRSLNSPGLRRPDHPAGLVPAGPPGDRRPLRHPHRPGRHRTGQGRHGLGRQRAARRVRPGAAPGHDPGPRRHQPTYAQLPGRGPAR